MPSPRSVRCRPGLAKKLRLTVELIAEMSPTCSIIVAAESGATIRMALTMRPRLSPALARIGNTVSFRWTGHPTQGAAAMCEKSMAGPIFRTLQYPNATA